MKKPLIAAAMLSTLGMGFVGVGTAFAATPERAELGPKAEMTAIVNAIAEKFHLSAADVQAVVTAEHDQFMSERHDAIDAKFDDMLAQAVTDGKLTQAQADLITAKQAEVVAFRKTLKDMTAEERKAAIKDEVAALKDWAKANNIPEKYVQFGFHGRHGHIMKGKK